MPATALDDIEWLFSTPRGSVPVVYDRAAARSDRFRELWLRLAGADAEQALVDDLRAVLGPSPRC